MMGTDGGTRALAQPRHSLDDDAARENIEEGGDAERRQAFHLAVAVVMLVVGGPVSRAHRDPCDDGRTEIDQRMERVRDQREGADGDADDEFRRRKATAGQDRNRGHFFLLAADHGQPHKAGIGGHTIEPS